MTASIITSHLPKKRGFVSVYCGLLKEHQRPEKKVQCHEIFDRCVFIPLKPNWAPDA
jgi:hypothetical protein